MIEDGPVFDALLPIFVALETLRDFEPTTPNWLVEFREDGSIAIDMNDDGRSIIFDSAQAAADYYRAEYWLRKTFGHDYAAWPEDGPIDPSEN